MRPGRGGLGGTIFGALFALIVVGGTVAFLRTAGIHDVASGLAYFRGATPKVEQCYRNHGKGCIKLEEPRGSGLNLHGGALTNSDIGYSGVKKGSPYISDAIKHKKEDFIAAIDSLKTKDIDLEKEKIKVPTTQYPHFIPVKPGSCWSVENNILAKSAMKNTLKFKDANRKTTKDVSKACSITEGKWVDTYTGKVIKNRKNVKLDFVVPLKYVEAFGGKKWDSSKKQEFANDKDNFVIVKSESKKERAGKLPSDWQPKEDKYKCIVAKKYVFVLQKYDLSIDNKNKSALSRQVLSCDK